MGIQNMEACIGVPETRDEYLTRSSVHFHEHLGFRMVGEFINADLSLDAGIIWLGWKSTSESMVCSRK